MTDERDVISICECIFCGGPNLEARVELGIHWCKGCTNQGLQSRARMMVLVCGHKSGYQPMFIEDVAKQAYNPKKTI